MNLPCGRSTPASANSLSSIVATFQSENLSVLFESFGGDSMKEALAQGHQAFVAQGRFGENFANGVEGIKVFVALGGDARRVVVEQGRNLIALSIKPDVGPI